MLTEKLTNQQKKELLKTLFGFDLIDINANSGIEKCDERWVIYDEEGNEFYASNENCQFDFSTLAGFFSYTAHRAKNQGYLDAQWNIKRALGIF